METEEFAANCIGKSSLKVLGLDLGVGSIGWALIEVTEEDKKPVSVTDMGVRIVSLSKNDSDSFTNDNKLTSCGARTVSRGMRRNLDRFQQRRYTLSRQLEQLGMLPPPELGILPPVELWSLRARAAVPGERLALSEIGRVLLHMNQKRGYKSSRREMNVSKKDTDCVTDINQRYQEAQEAGQTVGQYFYARLKDSLTPTAGGKVCTYKIKTEVFPRKAYEEEFDAIMNVQAEFYPEILNEENVKRLKHIIFFQRPLKSCKHLVSTCEFEKRIVINEADGKQLTVGPRVAARTSPLAQLCKIREAANNIEFKPIRRAKGTAQPFEFTAEDRRLIVEFMMNNEKLTSAQLFKLFPKASKNKYTCAESLGKGLQGNTTLVALREALADWPDAEKLLRFDLKMVETGKVNDETGEVLVEIDNQSMLEQPLYRLWHTIYSIDDPEELKAALRKNFGISDEETLGRLIALDFKTPGYASRSSKFMRRILPYLELGMKYSEACEAVGVRHSGYKTNEENAARELKRLLTPLRKGELRQPVVEKVLNQMIALVNALIERYGPIDEVRIELARELRQTKEQRLRTSATINRNEAARRKFAEEISQYCTPTRQTIEKYALWEESGKCCIYCGRSIGVHELLLGNDMEREHIIPRSVFFDDSFANKACSCRTCNQAKGNLTAYEWMSSQGDEKFAAFLKRIEDLYKKKIISRTKYQRLMTPQKDIPTDFLNRDLTLSQYIARKAYEILSESIRKVTATSGTVTALLRHLWGYDEILHTLCLPRYREAGLTEIVDRNINGNIRKMERIQGWSKRVDHRHDAIDALTIALTRQRYITRLNNLSSERDNMYAELTADKKGYTRKEDLVRDWCAALPHFDFNYVLKNAGRIAISSKAGKRLATRKDDPSRRKITEDDQRKKTLTPRGPLTEESVYGRIRRIVRSSLESVFDTPSVIISPVVRRLVEERLAEFGGNSRKAKGSLKKTPILIKGKPVTDVSVYEECFVIRYKVEDITSKKLDDVIDKKVREAIAGRIRECGGDAKYKNSLADRPLTLDKEGLYKIETVRCRAKLTESGVACLRKDSDGDAIAFAKKGSNHHVALYIDSKGNIQERVVSFWNAIMRLRYGVPAIVTNPAQIWKEIEESGREFPDDILASLPDPSWTYKDNLQIDQKFLIGLTDEQIDDAFARNDKKLLCEHLYRVQKLSSGDYYLRIHTQTTVDQANENVDRQTRMLIRIKSMKALLDGNLTKVAVDVTGNISLSDS